MNSQVHRSSLVQAICSRRSLCAALGGLCIVLSFAPFDGGPLVFLALPLLLRAVQGCGYLRGFVYGYISGLVIEGGGFYWIANTASAYGQFIFEGNVDPTTERLRGFAILFAWWIATALFWGIFGALLTMREGFAARWWCPACSLMILESCFPRIFPWSLCGAFAGWNCLAQGAWWLGVAGLSGMVVLVGTLIHQSCQAILEKALRRSISIMLLAGLLLVVWSAAGACRTRDSAGSQVLRVGYVQPNVALAERYAPDFESRNRVLQHLLLRTSELSGNQPDLIVWPEASFPFAGTPEEITELARTLTKPLLMGAVGPSGENRAYLLEPRTPGHAERIRYYDKRYLLAFGERFPAWVEKLGIGVPGSLPSGKSVSVWEIAGARVGPSICFEGILPSVAHDLAQSGANVHVNITEDLWFGDTSEPYQHLALTIMSAIEAGLPLVRVTNAGISACVDRCGKVLDSTRLHEEATGVFDVPVAGHHEGVPWSQSASTIVMWLFPLLILLRFLVKRGSTGTHSSAAQR